MNRTESFSLHPYFQFVNDGDWHKDTVSGSPPAHRAQRDGGVVGADDGGRVAEDLLAGQHAAPRHHVAAHAGGPAWHRQQVISDHQDTEDIFRPPIS